MKGNTSYILCRYLQIRFQPGDLASIREIADEISNIENINHPNLVKCYGVEVHRVRYILFIYTLEYVILLLSTSKLTFIIIHARFKMRWFDCYI